MTQKWQTQIRIDLSMQFAEAARRDINDPALKPLADVLAKHDAELKNQFDAFTDFCRATEQEAAQESVLNKGLRFLKIRKGPTDTALYRWTKDTIERPGKEKQYATRFAIYADGGRKVYDERVGKALIKDLEPLMKSGMIRRISSLTEDPAKNPQAPKEFRW